MEERFRALRRRPKERARLREEREAAVVRVEFGSAKGLWVPQEPLPPPFNAGPPQRLEGPAVGGALAGVDALGRAVVVRSVHDIDPAPEAVVATAAESTDTWVLHSRVLTWTGSRLEVVGFLTHRDVSHVTWVDHDADGQPERFATVGVPFNDFGKGAELAWLEWDGGRCRRVRKLLADERGRWTAHVAVGEYDADGLVRVRATSAPLKVVRVPGAWDGLAAVDVRWRRDLHGHESDPLAPLEAMDAWVEAVAAAAQRAVAAPDAGADHCECVYGEPATAEHLADACVLRVAPDFREARPALVIGTRAHAAKAAQHVGPRETLDRLWEPALPLLPHVDVAGLRAWRSLRQQEVNELSDAAVEGLQRRLAAIRWPGDAVALVAAGHPWEVAARVLGQERLDVLLAALGPRRSRPVVERPPADRGELEALLRAHALSPSLAAQARWGLALVAGGRGRSRLGGRAELPAGLDWPRSNGRALTHLATIALDELPEVQGRELLPPTERWCSSPT